MFFKNFFDYLVILLVGGSAGWTFYFLQTTYGSRNDLIVFLFLSGFIFLTVYFFYVLNNPAACLPFIICTSFIVYLEPAPFDILMIIAMVTLVLNMISSNKKMLPTSIAEICLVVFILCNISNVFQSYDTAQGIKQFTITLFMGAIFLFISKLSDSDKIVNYQLQLFLVPSIITSCALILGYLCFNLNIDLGAINEIIIEEGRPRAFFKDSNVAGPFLILSAAYTLATILQGSLKKKRIYILLFFLFCSGIVLTFSRGALLALCFTIVLLTILNFNLKRLIKFLLILILAACPLLLLIKEPAEKGSISARIFDIRFGVSDRIERIENGLSIFRQNPLIGTGMRLPFGKAPHDTYFLLLTQQGLIGFFCFWIPIIYIICNILFIHQPKSIPNKIVQTTLGATLLAHMVLGLVIYFIHWRHFWYIAGLSVAAIRLAEKAAKSPVPVHPKKAFHKKL